ncbi:MAG: helix-turn-helix transcriptional regulator [Lachnospiraceae bacterium]|jgi:transcriptional regulator with XRE-family HTH domain|nr:helix-turn-helix transcriptional regulator [Lachnospiraceae bacterium]MDE7001186.1 helix-turn-helix domain-containing protein [Lachnospiraceae bacterium]
MQSIADRLILLRNKYNLSQTDVAHQIGVTPALISAYEKLERKPSIDKLVALADIFHVSTDYILGRTFKDDSAAVLSVDGLSEKQIRIVRELIYELRSNGKTGF